MYVLFFWCIYIKSSQVILKEFHAKLCTLPCKWNSAIYKLTVIITTIITIIVVCLILYVLSPHLSHVLNPYLHIYICVWVLLCVCVSFLYLQKSPHNCEEEKVCMSM